MNPKNHARVTRYRQLALAEADKAKAAVLYKIPNIPALTEAPVEADTGTASGLWLPDDHAERGGRADHPKPMPVILTTDEERDV